ncbi:hypothetical protein TSUD_79150 [Trifolium subterraneum]|uniref:VQ domain-containing protein n=1 Tax=Trifolium subterraneum TaxID=3900 RepID=A0A2Z6MAE3_TRISU|nr:hypothetical protein TSUD_79150 [Trifolium subterraneum]
MDSVNTSRSGSMQSSTSCNHEIDQKYDDSRAKSSISPNFLNNNNQQPSTHVGPFTTMCHSLYFHTSQTTEQPLPNINLDTMWSGTARSEPNKTGHITGLMPCSSSSSLLQHQIMNNNYNNGSVHLATNCDHTRNDQARNNTSTNNTDVQVRNRNPKKRSRASRRAPTTVLTTDITNFRAMVQEFTGIPESSPFITSSHHFPRTRLDLFASSSPITSFPPYNLLRPFAQKLNNQPHHPIPPPSSSSIHNQLSCSVDNSKQPLNNIFNMQNQNQNQVFSFQTIHRTPQRQKYEFPFGNSSVTVSKTQIPSLETPSIIDDPHLKMGHGFEELGILRQDCVGSKNNGSKEWVQENVTHDTITNNDCDDSAGRELAVVNYSNTVAQSES